MKALALRFLTGAALLGIATAAQADPFTATGFGETASGAITNAAVNAVREAAGSRITVRQEVETKIVNGVPDERFIEELLEVSRGTISHLQVMSVTPVGDLFQAEVTVEIDSGQLIIPKTETEKLAIRPGAFAGAVAKAKLRAGGRSQLQDAIEEFVSIDSKVATVTLAAIETNEEVLRELTRAGRLEEGLVPLRVVVEISNKEGIVQQLEDALKAAGDEIAFQPEFIKWASGATEIKYRCDDNDKVTRMMKSFVLLRSERDSRADFVDIRCGSADERVITRVAGSAESMFVLGSAIAAEEAMKDTTIRIVLNQEDGSEKSFNFQISAEDSTWPIMAPDGMIAMATTDGKDVLLKDMLNYKFSPSALLSEEYTHEPRAWMAFDKIGLSFTIPVPPDVTESTVAVGVIMSRL